MFEEVSVKINVAGRIGTALRGLDVSCASGLHSRLPTGRGIWVIVVPVILSSFRGFVLLPMYFE
jgi:hypothetical protein